MADRIKTILLVNDNPGLLKAMGAALGWAGFVVIPAKNGLEAFNMARIKQPDIVVSDIVMGFLNGFELCRCIRATDIIKSLPVILFSNMQMSKADFEEAKASGVNACLPGSPNLSALLKAIRELLP